MDFNIRSELVIYRGGSIPKTMINDIRVSQLVIAKMNNGKARQLHWNVGTVSQTVRSGNGPYIEPCPPRALLTVFSTTQLGHLITQYEFIPSRF